MKKVVYGVSRYVKGDITKITGIGYITDTDLVIACMSKKGTPYIKVFEDCVKDCHPIPNRDKEYKGGYYEIREVEFEQENGSKETREITIEYNIWYKLAD